MAPRLLARFEDNLLPTFQALGGGLRQAIDGAFRFDRHDAMDAEFGCFLDHPFEVIELDECGIKSEGGPGRGHGQLTIDAEADGALGGIGDSGFEQAVVVGDLILLPGLNAEDAREMAGFVAVEFGVAAVNCGNEEEAACHAGKMSSSMIAFLRGTLLEKHPNQVIVDVGGVGYDVVIPVSAFSGLPETGQEVRLRIHTHVREDALILYGFLEERDRQLFEKLITVSGVGPKMAVTVLSGLNATEAAAAIRGGDAARLTRVPGIGKKTAERLVLELREKLDLIAPGGAAAPAASPKPAFSAMEQDVLSALLNLGCGRPQAEAAVEKAKAGGAAPEFESLFRRSLELVR